MFDPKGECLMTNDISYRTLTREQFLFSEMRITARLMLQGLSDEDIFREIEADNLYQYPTNKMVRNITSVCLRRLHKLDSERLVELIANGSSSVAKQTCLYAMIKYYLIVYDFMVGVIGEKYRLKDMSYSHMDVNVLFTRLQEQNETVASWSESTIRKNKQVLTRLLVENEYLDSISSTTLNPVLIDLELKEVLKERNEKAILSAFDCFE